jgi:hypothetical protein
LEDDHQSSFTKDDFECDPEYYNPKVMSIESREIGEWYDEHPLNYATKQKEYFDKLFT